MREKDQQEEISVEARRGIADRELNAFMGAGMRKPKMLPRHIRRKDDAPLSPDLLREKIDEQKALIEYQSKLGDLPVDFPTCSKQMGHVVLAGMLLCPEPASFAIQEDYQDPKSPLGFLCSVHIMILPEHPEGKVYRIWKCSVRNYRMLLTKQKENNNEQ